MKLLILILLFVLFGCDPVPAKPTGDNTTITADTTLNIKK